MKNTFKTSLLGFFIVAALAGCSYTPVQAPKTEAERIETKSLLHVPVDVSNFKTHKLNIVADNGDKGRITVFTDPKTGKTYDLDGQPINEKGERILANGDVCKPGIISFGMRGYGTSLNPRYECWTSTKFSYVNGDDAKNNGKIYGGTIGAIAAINPVVALGALVTSGAALMAMPADQVTDDMPDTM